MDLALTWRPQPKHPGLVIGQVILPAADAYLGVLELLMGFRVVFSAARVPTVGDKVLPFVVVVRPSSCMQCVSRTLVRFSMDVYRATR